MSRSEKVKNGYSKYLQTSLINYQLKIVSQRTMASVSAGPVPSSPAGTAAVPDCKAAWWPASQGALEPWHHGRPGCSDNQGVEMGSGPTVDQVVQAGAGQLHWNLVELKQNKGNIGQDFFLAINKKISVW